MTEERNEFEAMLSHIAAARDVGEPNAVQVTEMQRALKGYLRPAIKAGVNNFLIEDTKVINRLPLPAELLPYVQAESRRIIAEARTAQPEATCMSCGDTGWIEAEGNEVTRCHCKGGPINNPSPPRPVATPQDDLARLRDLKNQRERV